MLHVILTDLPPGESILAGAVLGASHATLVANQSQTAAGPLCVVLDFKNVEAVTASYLKQLFLVFFPPADEVGGSTELYPLVTNLEDDDVRFELQSYLEGKEFALQEVVIKGTKVHRRELVGRLDGALREAYRQLLEHGASAASQLYARNKASTSNQTAWNNRLVRLLELRLAHRARVGRNWIYEPAFNLK